MTDTDWASLEQPNLKERASSALEKRVRDRNYEWDEEALMLWDDTISFFKDVLLFSHDEIDEFENNAELPPFDNKNNKRPSITWTHEGMNFKISYVTEQVATIQVDSGTRTEKINDLKLHVNVDNRRGGWKRIESLADLGELLAKWI